MPEISVVLADRHPVTFDGAVPGMLADTCFVLGVRKCGSSIMNAMVADLARVSDRHYLDVAGGFFQADIPERVWRNDPMSQKLLVPGQTHGGFRAMPLVFADHDIFKAAQKILLVRDPRDALVSEYFSNAYTHTLPQQDDGVGATKDMLALRQTALKASIETYVLTRAAALDLTFMEYAGLADDPRLKIFRYEDVIFDKRQWLIDIAGHFGWPAPDTVFLNDVMGWADVVPDAEQADQFIRKVRPGDHKDKLGPAVIACLNSIMAPTLRLFGY